MIKFQLTILLVIASVEILSGQSYSSLPYIVPCDTRDTNAKLNECFRRTFQRLTKHLAGGLRELNVPPFDPLKIPEFDLENNFGGFNFKIKLRNFVARGGTDVQIVEVKNNIAKLRLDIKTFIPRLSATGFYDGSGSVLGFPVRAKGKFFAEFSGVSAIARIYGREEYRNGQLYMHMNNVIVDYVVQKSLFRVQDELAPGLSEEYGAFLTSNQKELIRSTKRSVSKIIGEFFHDVLQSAFSAYPLRTFMVF